MLESGLPTPEETELLLKWADPEVALIRDAAKTEGKRGRPLCVRRPDKFRPKGENLYEGFGDVLRVYWHTGARTGELAACTVSDSGRSAKQTVLGRHMRVTR